MSLCTPYRCRQCRCVPQSLVVSEDRLAAVRGSLASVTSEHVFSLQRHPVCDTTVLYGADLQERQADPTAFNRLETGTDRDSAGQKPGHMRSNRLEAGTGGLLGQRWDRLGFHTCVVWICSLQSNWEIWGRDRIRRSTGAAFHIHRSETGTAQDFKITETTEL